MRTAQAGPMAGLIAQLALLGGLAGTVGLSHPDGLSAPPAG